MDKVTSFAEVWIEISGWGTCRGWWRVTSFAEVWIEIHKYHKTLTSESVTSFAEVWIEIPLLALIFQIGQRHFLRGSVD